MKYLYIFNKLSNINIIFLHAIINSYSLLQKKYILNILRLNSKLRYLVERGLT